MVSRSGTCALVLLGPPAAATPLRWLFPGRPWVRWLAERRSELGAACLAYALVHAGTYLMGKGDVALVLREARQGWVLAGWAALGLFLAFAATTDDAAARALRRSWRRLHRSGLAHDWLDRVHRALARAHRVVYLGASLVVLHWLLSAFDPLTMQVQTVLRAEGYYDGPIDGIIGVRSRAAIEKLQSDRGIPVTGMISPELLDHLGIVPN